MEEWKDVCKKNKVNEQKYKQVEKKIYFRMNEKSHWAKMKNTQF